MLKKGLFFSFIIYSFFLFSNPHGHKIVHGKAAVSKEKNKLEVFQKSEKAIIEWEKFSIEKNETTHFQLPSKRASILNRVVGSDISHIRGTLSSNGRVYLINENGVIISPSGRIITAGFIASTLNIENELFLKDSLKFLGNSNSSFINEGEIIAEDSDVLIIAGSIKNKGKIEAKDSLNLCAGEVLLIEKNHPLAVKTNSYGTIENEGIIKAAKAELHANNENIYSLAINHKGIIDVCSVLLDAEKGKAIISGSIKAKNNETKKGGEVHILGKTLKIEKTAEITATGDNGGGEILIGGDYQGKNPLIVNSDSVFVEKDALINASALKEGNGGKVIIWSDRENIFSGTILSKGGEVKGDGGFVEISVKGNNLFYTGLVNTLSPKGKNGTLLLDPSDIDITNTSPSNPAYPTSPGVYNPGPGEPNPCNLYVVNLTTALASGNVTVSTSNGNAGSGIITVATPIVWTAANSLNLVADSTITINSSIGGASTVGDISLTADTLTVGADLQSTGTLYIIQKTLSRNINVNTTGVGTLDIPASSLNHLIAGFTKISIGASSGEVSTGTGTTTFDGTYTFNDPLALFNGTIVVNAGASLTSNAGSLTIPSVELVANNGNIAISGPATTITCSSANTGDGVKMLAPSPSGNTHGINCSGTTITTSNRNIYLSATGGPNSGDAGIFLSSTNLVHATGSGAITLIGVGGAGVANNQGVYIYDSTVSVKDGDITINGTDNYSSDAVFISGGTLSTIQSTGTGDIIITGTAGTNANLTSGITLGKATIVTTSSNINLNGTCLSTSPSFGIKLGAASPTTIQTGGTGTITLEGVGGAGTNQGIEITNVATITSFNGDINLHGYFTPSASTSLQVGVENSGTISSTGNGNISITGVGGANSTGNGCVGFNFPGTGGGNISSNGSGTITINGTGGGTVGNSCYGMVIYGLAAGNYITATNGDVILNGSAVASGSNNMGIRMDTLLGDTTGIDITGSGNLSLTGSGSGTNGSGILINSTFPSPFLNTATGNISMTGTGVGTGNAVAIQNTNISSISGNISLTQYTTSGGIGVVTSGGGGYTISTTGNITINTDTVTIDTNLSSTGILSIRPISALQNININTTGVGTLDLPASALAFFLDGFSKISIGNSISGTITIGALTTFSDPLELIGNNIAISNPLAVSTAADSITLISDLISVNANISASGGNGLLYFRTNTANRSIGLGDSSTGDYQLSTAAFSYIQSSFSNVYIGTTQDHVINVDYGITPVTYNYPLTITGKDITIAASNTIAAAAGKNVTLQIGRGTLAGTLNLNSSISVSGGGVFSASGSTFNDAFNIGASVNPTMTITGGAGTNTLSKTDGANSWQISGSNSGSINAVTNFSQINNLTGGTANDTFNFSDGATLSGFINGGDTLSTNTLDYSLWTSPVTINRIAQTASNLGGGFSNINNFIGNIIFFVPSQTTFEANILKIIEANFLSSELPIILLPNYSICSDSPLYYFDYVFFKDIRIENLPFEIGKKRWRILE